jgi:hypothetical protein
MMTIGMGRGVECKAEKFHVCYDFGDFLAVCGMMTTLGAYPLH